MLKIDIAKSGDTINEIRFIGHALYDVKGKDIVCAAVSSSMLTTVNAIMRFDEHSLKYEEADNVVITNLKKDDITNKLLDNLYCVLKELERQYPKFIKITEKGGK